MYSSPYHVAFEKHSSRHKTIRQCLRRTSTTTHPYQNHHNTATQTTIQAQYHHTTPLLHHTPSPAPHYRRQPLRPNTTITTAPLVYHYNTLPLQSLLKWSSQTLHLCVWTSTHTQAFNLTQSVRMLAWHLLLPPAHSLSPPCANVRTQTTPEPLHINFVHITSYLSSNPPLPQQTVTQTPHFTLTHSPAWGGFGFTTTVTTLYLWCATVKLKIW
jgi:hypothetical protein